MAWNSGTFSRFEGSSGCANKAAVGIGITAALEDQRFNEFATGINTCLTKDGQNTPTQDLNMGGFKHTNVGAATAGTNYATATQVVQSGLLYASTTGGTNTAYTASLPVSSIALASGAMIYVTFALTSGAAPTLAVNGGSAFPINLQDGTAVPTGAIISGRTYPIQQIGSSYVIYMTAGAALGGAQFPTASQVVSGALTYATTSGTSTAYTASLGISSGVTIQTGSEFQIKFHTTNGSAATLAINGGTARNLKYASGGNNLIASDIVVAGIYRVVFDGTNYLVYGVVEANYDNPRAHTPTVTPSGCSLSSTSIADSFYYVLGNWVQYSFSYDATVSGATSSSYIDFTLPVTPIYNHTLATPAFIGGTAMSNLTSTLGLISTGGFLRVGSIGNGASQWRFVLQYRR